MGFKGPIFEDGPNFALAFKPPFHGKDGVDPLSERPCVSNENMDVVATAEAMAAKAATICSSAFGSGGPFSKPTNLSFSSMNFPFPVRGLKGPIFEDGPNFDMAFKLFHGKDGVVPLSENENMDVAAAPAINPLAAKAATISLSALGPGDPFNFDSISKMWKKEKKKPESSRKENSAQGNSSKHEALGNEWLETGNCPIAKSYRAVSHVLPLMAKALQPPSGMKMKCPPAVVATRAALARTPKIAIGVLGMAANVPLGVWREHTTKFSLSWFVAVLAAVPFIAMLRKSVVMSKTAMALTIAASILGQIIGSRAERLRLKAKVDKVNMVADDAPKSAIAHSSQGQIDSTPGCHCGKQGTTCNLLPDNCAKSTSPPVEKCGNNIMNMCGINIFCIIKN